MCQRWGDVFPREEESPHLTVRTLHGLQGELRPGVPRRHQLAAFPMVPAPGSSAALSQLRIMSPYDMMTETEVSKSFNQCTKGNLTNSVTQM